MQTGTVVTPAPAPQRVVLARRKTPVTMALIGINAAVYVAMVLRGVSAVEPTTAQLLPWGANWGPLSLSTQPWRILASNYLHGGIIHIALNMWCLWSLGQLAEQIFDPWTYVLIYTVCGIAGSLASLWVHPMVIGVGASGAIFGMAGALMAALHLGHLPIPKAAVRGTLKSLLMFAVYNLFFGAVGRTIDNSAHIGGLIAGLAMGAVMAKHLMTPPEVRAAWRRIVFIGALVVLGAGFVLVRQAGAYVIQMEDGMRALQSGKYDDAVRALEQAYTRKPNDHTVLVLLASAYVQKEDYAKAVPLLEQAVRLDPNDAMSQFNLGLARLKQGQFDQAIPHLQKAVALDPKDTDARQALQQAEEGKHSLDGIVKQ